MAKKKADKAAEQEAPAETTTTETVSKADAVRAALKEGHDTPEAGIKYIKDKFGLAVNNQIFSSYKSIEKKKAEGGGGKPARATTNGHGSDAAGLARQVKALVEAHGADAVKEMADVFAE